MNATGDDLKGVHVPPALILNHVSTMQDDALGRGEKIILSIMWWFTQNGRPNIPEDELEIAYNIVITYSDGLGTQGLFGGGAAGAA